MKDIEYPFGNGVLPAHAPAYPKTWYCEYSHMFAITVEGNERAIKDVLSYTPFEYVSPLYQLWFCNLVDHTLDKTKNGYLECAITIPVRFGEHYGGFTPYMYCTCIPAIMAGREIYGYPKQYADITWTETSIAISASVKKDGVELLKASFVYDDDISAEYRKEMEQLEKLTTKRLLFKTMPNAFASEPELRQVILRDTGRKTVEMELGRASLKIGTLQSDPIYRLEVMNILGAKYTTSNYGGNANLETKTLLATL